MKKISKSLLIVSCIVIFSNNLVNVNPFMVNAGEIVPISRVEQEIKKTPTYEEKKITLKIQKDLPNPTGREKIDFQLLIDASGSMKESDSLVNAKKALNKFIDTRNPNYDRIGITVFRGPGYDVNTNKVLYEKSVENIHPMDNNFGEAKNVVNSIVAGGLTPLLDGLNKSKEILDANCRKDADRKILIVFGDGHPNVGPERNYFISNLPKDYYGKHPSYYPGENIQKQQDELEYNYTNNKISHDEYTKEITRLSNLQNMYPPGTKTNLSESKFNSDLNGVLYDNSKAEFYDLKYLIEQKANDIKNSGYEIFSVYLNNEHLGVDNYKYFLENTNELQNLFKSIAQQDEKHYYYANTADELPQTFEKVGHSINTFDYFMKDQIEDGFELVPGSFTSSKEGAINKMDGNTITWDVSNVPYDSLEVSYNIKKETKNISKGSLVVKYLEEGNNVEIFKKEVTINSVGESYSTEQKHISGYNYIKVDGEENGKYVDGTTVVTYYYRKIKQPPVINLPETSTPPTEKTGTVIVKYEDETTKTDLVDPIEITNDVGASYITMKKDIPKYKYVKVEGQESGKYVNEIITVTYYYKKVEQSPPVPPKIPTPPVVKKGTVIVKYKDKDTDKDILAPLEMTNDIDASYSVEDEDITGYEYVDVDGEEDGEYIDGTIIVTYYYKKIVQTPKTPPIVNPGKLIVKYKDKTTRKEILDKIEITNDVGTPYITEKKDITGYEYVQVEGEESGKYIDGTIIVTYLYKQTNENSPNTDIDKDQKNETLPKPNINKSSKNNSLPKSDVKQHLKKVGIKKVFNEVTDTVTNAIKKNIEAVSSLNILPKTGETKKTGLYILGSILILGGLYIRKKR